MQYNILHLARALDFFIRRPDENNPLTQDSLLSIAALSQIDEETAAELFSEIFPQKTSASGQETFEALSDFFMHVSSQMSRYSAEVERRIKHAEDVGIYIRDTPEQTEAKLNEHKDVCVTNQYFSGYLALSKAGIDSTRLSIYEALLLIDELTIQTINEGSHQLLAMIASDRPADEERFKKYLKHSNFVMLALDIYNALDKIWTQVSKKDRTTSRG